MTARADDRTDLVRHGLAVVAVVAGLFATASVLPTGDGDQPAPPAPTASSADQNAAATSTVASSTPTTSPTTIAEPSTTVASAPPSSTADTTVPVTTAAVDESPLETTASSTDETPPGIAQVVAIQTVPAVRDLAIAFDGRTVTTDRGGLVDIGPDDFDARAEVVGVAADPPISQVRFLQWSDGSTETSRDLTNVPGPVVQLGLELRHRVKVELAPTSDLVTSVVIDSALTGPIELVVGEPTWLVAATAKSTQGALVATEVDYSIDDVPGDETFRVRPETTWIVDVRS